jgi:hypothetical protein
MAYMFADTYRQVGFRPYGQTNPRRAAQLSGLGQNRPLDPWVLHQNNMGYLGQAHPFDQDPGGWVLHGLGSLSPSMVQLAEAHGLSASDVDLLDSVGATDQDIENLVNGNITLTDLYANYGVTIPPLAPPPQQTSVQTVPANTAPLGTGEVPRGSVLLYTASWNASQGGLPQSAIQALQASLPGHGMSLVDSKVTGYGLLGPSAIEVHILDSVGHDTKANAQKIPDGILWEHTGYPMLGSHADVVSSPGAPSGLQRPGATNWSAWFQTNWEYVALAAGLLIVAGPIAQGMSRRR